MSAASGCHTDDWAMPAARLMPALREAFPRLRLYLREDTTARLVDQPPGIAAGGHTMDCGGAGTMPVPRDTFVVALPHRLAVGGLDSGLRFGDGVAVVARGRALPARPTAGDVRIAGRGSRRQRRVCRHRPACIRTNGGQRFWGSRCCRSWQWPRGSPRGRAWFCVPSRDRARGGRFIWFGGQMRRVPLTTEHWGRIWSTCRAGTASSWRWQKQAGHDQRDEEGTSG